MVEGRVPRRYLYVKDERYVVFEDELVTWFFVDRDGLLQNQTYDQTASR
jgi:hypothetical protein